MKINISLAASPGGLNAIQTFNGIRVGDNLSALHAIPKDIFGTAIKSGARVNVTDKRKSDYFVQLESRSGLSIWVDCGTLWEWFEA